MESHLSGPAAAQTTWILKTNFSEADDLLGEAVQLCQVAIQAQADKELL